MRWVLWEGAELVAVNKPAGVLSQGGEGGAGVNLVDLARKHLRCDRIGVLHRLDRNVSGVVLLARERDTAAAMSALLRAGAIERVYRAVVRGKPTRDRLTIDAALAKDPRTREVRAASPEELAAMPDAARRDFRPARTEVTVLRRFRTPIGPCAELELRLVTGRSHQIRAHLAHAGLPIVGDPKYGVLAAGLSRPLLHAARVAFVHPRTGARIAIDAPLPWRAEWLSSLAPRTRARTPRMRRPRTAG